MSIPFRPILDRVICIKPSGETTRESGIIIPTSADDHEEVEVVAVGPGKRREDGTHEPMDVQVGDRILVNKYQVQDIGNLPGCDGLLALKNEDIRMVLNR